MRNVTAAVVGAFLSGLNLKQGNSESFAGELRLFGNVIARKADGGVEITDATWVTATTRERLNALPGVALSIKSRKWILNGEEWDGSWKFIPTPKEA